MVSSYPQLPQTSSAVNIQIIEPKNFPGGAVPGQVTGAGSPGMPPSPYSPAAIPPYYNTQPTAPFSPVPVGSPPGTSPMAGDSFGTPFPAMDPRQSLQNAYAEALRARTMAEQARNSYLNMANQLNSMTFQQQPQPQPQYYPQGQPVNNPFYFPQPQPQYYPPQQPFQSPEGMMSPQPQQVSTQPNQEQPLAPPANTPQTATLEDLNTMVDQPATLQERVDAMEEIGVRGFGTPKTYELLQREALANTDHLEGLAKDDANYVRQAALWTLGMLNKAQNATVPTDSLPGLNAIEQILKDKRENPDVKSASVQALQVINRPNDKRIKKVLKKASKDKDPNVSRLAKEALSGKTIPIPAALQLR